jgi:hypothetical protein
MTCRLADTSSNDFHDNLAMYRGEQMPSHKIQLTMPAMGDSAVHTTLAVSLSASSCTPADPE